jgi:pimeloyl-ACP methyl ester carboxylesterase
MTQVVPFFKEAGNGPTVLCLHSNASHSGQWRGLMDQLSDRFRVVAVDSWGSGRTAEWPSDRVIRLADEVELLQPLLDSASGPLHLVGHSYGAAVALKAALLHPGRFAGWRCTSRPCLRSWTAPRRATSTASATRCARAASGWMPATATAPRAPSSTSGWVKAAGSAPRPSAGPRWSSRSATCGAGGTPS